MLALTYVGKVFDDVSLALLPIVLELIITFILVFVNIFAIKFIIVLGSNVCFQKVSC